MQDGHRQLLLIREAAGKVVAGVLRHPPDISRSPVNLLNRKRNESCPLVPASLGVFTTVVVENPRKAL